MVASRIDEAYQNTSIYQANTTINISQKLTAGFPALKQAMIDNHTEYPDKRIDIKRVIVEGDVVAAHSPVSLNPGDKNIAVVHLFRFQTDGIVEVWDIG